MLVCKEKDMASTTQRSTAQQGFAPRKLLWVGPLTIVVAAAVNMALRTIAVSFFSVSDGFMYFQPSYVIGGTVIYLLLALLAFILVGRRARHPAQVYRIVALVALCVSFLTPVMALTGLFPAAGMNLHIFWTMLAMHIISALITVGLLTTLAVERS